MRTYKPLPLPSLPRIFRKLSQLVATRALQLHAGSYAHVCGSNGGSKIGVA